MTTPQNYVAIPVEKRSVDTQLVDTQQQMGVHYKYGEDEIDTGWNRRDAIDFFSMLRCALLQIIRWIERRYPEAVK